MKIYGILCAAGIALAASAFGAKSPKYVFVFIGDGMSTPQRMVADEFSRESGRGPLAMNSLPYQSTTRTRAANALITDSAAAATAIACGEKANNCSLGVVPDGTRLESVAEVAHKKGMKVGIMTTVTIVHATPAGFYAHRKSRGEYYNIALDLLDSGFEFFAGGGVYDKYDDVKNPNYRGDIFDLARKAGYAVVTNKADFAALRPGCGKAWGVFNKFNLDFSIDRTGRHPSLADMVGKAVELLDGPQGFFIMAEGGRLDAAAHANDPATVVHEAVAMDDAVKVALAFAERHPDETLIVTTGDHETGGMAMGFVGTGYKFYVGLLAKQKCATDTFSDMIAERIGADASFKFDDAKALVTEYFGLVFDESAADTPEKKLLLLKPAEVDELRKAFQKDVEFVAAKKTETRAHDVKRRRQFAATAKRLLSNHAGVGWSSGAHTALPTMTTAGGCGAENFIGFLENYDIARKLKALLR